MGHIKESSQISGATELSKEDKLLLLGRMKAYIEVVDRYDYHLCDAFDAFINEIVKSHSWINYQYPMKTIFPELYKAIMKAGRNHRNKYSLNDIAWPQNGEEGRQVRIEAINKLIKELS